MEQRIKGQEVGIRVVQAGNIVTAIDSISAFNEQLLLELKEQGYLGETVNRFDEIFNGYGGDMEYHVSKASWVLLEQAIIDRATRRTPNVIFNVIRTDFFPNGDSLLISYEDVNWGPIPTSIPTRTDYVKIRQEFRTSRRPIKINALP